MSVTAIIAAKTGPMNTTAVSDISVCPARHRMPNSLCSAGVGWLRGTVVRTLVFDRRNFHVPRSTCS